MFFNQTMLIFFLLFPQNIYFGYLEVPKTNTFLEKQEKYLYRFLSHLELRKVQTNFCICAVWSESFCCSYFGCTAACLSPDFGYWGSCQNVSPISTDIHLQLYINSRQPSPYDLLTIFFSQRGVGRVEMSSRDIELKA